MIWLAVGACAYFLAIVAAGVSARGYRQALLRALAAGWRTRNGSDARRD